MSDTFTLGGDPTSIRASGASWKSFASSAGSASSDIRAVDSTTFQGDEADTYRGKVNDDLPPRLDKTHEAWNQVGVALTTYSYKLEDFQSRLATLKSQYDAQVQTAKEKSSAVDSAKSADKTHDDQQLAAKKALKPGETLPPSNYQSGTSSAVSALTEANSAVQDTINKANGVRSEHRDALNACCNEINDAKGKRFEKPPGFWGRLKDSVVDWVKDHADILKKISGVLKIISAIAGVLSFIPILAPIMGPIALVTGGAALLIDVGVKLATGEGSWLSIGIDAACMLIPGAGKLIGKGLKATTSGTKVLNSVKGAKAAVTTKVVTTVKNSKVVTVVKNSKVVVGGKNAVSRVKLPLSKGRFNAKNGAPKDIDAYSVNMPTNRVFGTKVKVNGTTMKVRKTGSGYKVTVKNNGVRTTHEVPKGTRAYHGDGAPPKTTGRSIDDRGVNRSSHPTASNGVKVSSSPEQNAMADRTVRELQDGGATNVRVDQSQAAANGERTTGPNTVNTNRPDVQGTVGEQRVHFEYDRPSGVQDGPRAATHAGDILHYDPSAIVITVPGG